MKILVVEDDTEKLRNIVAVLVEIDGVSLDDVEQFSDAVRAKGHLRENAVDLIVLDLHLPDRLDLPPRLDGGLQFIRSITSRPQFHVPPHVVAVSGNQEAVSELAANAGEIWGVIRYDPTDMAWRDQLKARVRYALAAQRAEAVRRREARMCDVAIITALAEELSGVLRLPLGWSERIIDGDGTVYHEGMLETSSGRLAIVAASANRMGMAASAALTSKIIEAYRPRIVCMAGLAGGIRGRVALGDVIVADPSWDWGSGKFEVVGGAPRFANAPEQLRISPDIRNKLAAAATDEALMSRVRSTFSGTKPDNVLRCHLEAVASGAAVLGDDAVVEQVKSQHRKLHGVEMEIYGLMMAVELCTQPRPLAFSAKGISDFADIHKGDDMRAYAIHVSVNFIFEFLKAYVRPAPK